MRVVLDVGSAGARALRVGVEDTRLTGPVTAEGGVENDVLDGKVGVDVAVRSTLKQSGRIAPARRVGVWSAGIARCSRVRPEPDLDGAAGPFHSIDTASVIVEAIAVRNASSGLDTTALVTQAILVDQSTARAGMHGHGVLVVVVDTLDDVDLPIIRPFC